MCAAWQDSAVRRSMLRLDNILIRWLLLSLLLIGLPMAGVALHGRPIGPLLEFPPRTVYIEHAPFSAAVVAVVALLAALALLIVLWLAYPRRHYPIAVAPHAGGFPWWGWLGAVWLLAVWALAWTRLPWFASLQPHTFAPLWLGYIVVINAFSYRRQGRCLLVDRPGYLALLFPASAVFWWYFEYLNRFVQNWYYHGVEAFGPSAYALHASLAFATVLPAFASTREWLQGVGWLQRGYRGRWQLPRPATTGAAVLVLASVALLGLGVWPDVLFPVVWVAPLLLIVGLQLVAGDCALLGALRAGDWTVIYQSAIAALLCGLLWELWNSRSYAHWEYSVPFVQRWHLFEMPLLGYAGYLPFGLECAVIVEQLGRLYRQRGTKRHQAGHR